MSGRIDDVVLAANEAVSNVVRHAYPGVRGEVEVEVQPRPEGVTVVIRDEGRGFQTPTDNPGAGLGTRLMEGAANAVSIGAGRNSGTEVVLSFQR
jgi:two-component sensor histidine kinase